MASTNEGPGRRPTKRPYGRPAPPPGYPKDTELYADPENLLYPVNTPVRARLARRYFDDEKNRSKYTEEERQYIDAKINDLRAMRSALNGLLKGCTGTAPIAQCPIIESLVQGPQRKDKTAADKREEERNGNCCKSNRRG